MKTFVLIVALVLPLLSVLAQDALPPVYEIKTDSVLEYTLATNHYQMLPDKMGKLTIGQVSKPPVANQFFSRSNKPNGVDTIVNTFWFRYRIRNSLNKKLNVSLDSWSDKSDFFVFRDNNKMEHYYTGNKVPWKKKDGIISENIIPIELGANEEILIYYRIENVVPGIPSFLKIDVLNTEKYGLKRYLETQTNVTTDFLLFTLFSGFCLLAAFFNFLFFLSDREKVYLYFSSFLLFIALSTNSLLAIAVARSYPALVTYINATVSYLWVLSFIQFIRQYFHTFQFTPRWDKFLIAFNILPLLAALTWLSNPNSPVINIFIGCILLFGCSITLLLFFLQRNSNAKPFAIAILPFILTILFLIIILVAGKAGLVIPPLIEVIIRFCMILSVVWCVLYFTWILVKQYDQQKKKIAENTLQVERLAKEKEIERRELIEQQKVELEYKVAERTSELKHSLDELRSTQQQLIQSEKMASLGELTAGIAHEIQNPLNFVNNFSDVNTELIEEAEQEIGKGNIDEAKLVLADLKENEQKINHHGKRADAIVKGMLQHSRANTGKKEPTDINALADEYLRLSYHGLRAKDKDFNADFKTQFDESIGKIEVLPQDIGRVLLNLYNNAFYAINEKKRQLNGTFEPLVTVTTKRTGDKVQIVLKDNGNGIPAKIIDKIFQPFFTTKPTGQGTGLGLSLSYDIVKAHGGEIMVESKEGEGSGFTIELPV